MFLTKSDRISMTVFSAGLLIYVFFDAFDIVQAIIYTIFTLIFATLLLIQPKSERN